MKNKNQCRRRKGKQTLNNANNDQKFCGAETTTKTGDTENPKE